MLSFRQYLIRVSRLSYGPEGPMVLTPNLLTPPWRIQIHGPQVLASLGEWSMMSAQYWDQYKTTFYTLEGIYVWDPYKKVSLYLNLTKKSTAIGLQLCL